MSDLPIKATLKASGDYDAPWLTVDASDPNDLAFKLKALAEAGVFQALTDASSTLKGAYNAAPLTAPAPAQQQAPAAPSGWGQPAQQAPAPQQAAPQQQGGNRFGGRPHPEGKQCAACGQVLQYAETRTGKAQWKCGAYRWNNGSPNEHTLEWAN